MAAGRLRVGAQFHVVDVVVVLMICRISFLRKFYRERAAVVLGHHFPVVATICNQSNVNNGGCRLRAMTFVVTNVVYLEERWKGKSLLESVGWSVLESTVS